jgi:LysM repeat protein
MDAYIVEEGDNIENIGRKFNIPVIEIIKANNLTPPYLLTIGQSLTIPTNLYNIFDYYVVKKGDTLYSIAEKENITVDLIAGINGINPTEYIYENQTILIPKQGVELYITKDGDTIDTIAEHFSAPSVDVIYSNNDIYLMPGQLIIYRET